MLKWTIHKWDFKWAITFYKWWKFPDSECLWKLHMVWSGCVENYCRQNFYPGVLMTLYENYASVYFWIFSCTNIKRATENFGCLLASRNCYGVINMVANQALWRYTLEVKITSKTISWYWYEKNLSYSRVYFFYLFPIFRKVYVLFENDFPEIIFSSPLNGSKLHIYKFDLQKNI